MESQEVDQTWHILSASDLHGMCDVCVCFFNCFFHNDAQLQRFGKTMENKVARSCDKISNVTEKNTYRSIHGDGASVL